MLGSLPLSPQPTARETREIAFRLGHELAARGAKVHHDVIGGFRFQMAAPWRRAASANRAVTVPMPPSTIIHVPPESGSRHML